MIDRLRVDLSAAVRSLRASRGLVLAAVLMLALATGVNLVMLALVSRGLFAPPGLVSEPDRVHTLLFGARGDGEARMSTTSYPTFRNLREHVPAFAGAAAWHRTAGALVVSGEQVQADVMMVSGEYFPLLGVAPFIGRPIEPADDRPSAGGSPIVLSHGFWRSTFQSDRSVLGRRVSVAGLEYEVAGVMPDGFSGHSADRTDAWVPLSVGMQGSPGWQVGEFRNVVSIAVRLTPGAQKADAAGQATGVLGRRVALQPAVGAAVSATDRQIALGLAALSVLVVIIALANTATLLIVRGAARARDAALRLALGASRGRLLVQALCESAILAIVAAALAITLAYWFDESVRRTLFPQVVEQSGIKGSMVLAAALAAGLTAIVATFAGMAQLRTAGAGTLAGGPRVAGGRRILQRTLLVLQVTVSVVLLVGAGIFGRSLYTLAAQDFGFRLNDVLMVDFPPGPNNVKEHEFFTAAMERVRRLPGVDGVTPVQSVPFGSFHVLPLSAPGRPPLDEGLQLPYLIAATPELLDILGVPIVEGRGFTPADDRGAPVAIVNRSMAQTIWPGESALGKCFRIGVDPSFDPEFATGPPQPPLTAPCREVVGVSGDMRQRSLVPTGGEDRLMQYFVPFSQIPPPPSGEGGGPAIHALMLRASGDVDQVAGAVRRTVIEGRSDLPMLRVRAYAEILGGRMRPWRMATTLLALFAALALMVAAIGLYAAFAHVVVERRKEIAIRMAIGADRRRIRGMLLGEASRVAAIGTGAGAVGAALAGRLVESLLFGTAPADPYVLAAAAAVMATVALGATAFPARTAARTDPSTLLRAE